MKIIRIDIDKLKQNIYEIEKVASEMEFKTSKSLYYQGVIDNLIWLKEIIKDCTIKKDGYIDYEI